MRTKMSVVIVAAVLFVGLFCGCANNTSGLSSGKGGAASATDAAGKRVKVVCATFPAYDWVRQIAGEQADACEITYLMGAGVDLHSYQPSVEDIAKIKEADLFVYVGGESDGWARDIVEATKNPNLHAVSMLAAVGNAAVREEVVEGMQADEHEHESESGSGKKEDSDKHEHEGDSEYDEHVWLSLKHAQTLVNAIAGELAQIDPSHAEAYAANAKAYQSELADLDGRYANVVASAPKKTVVFADRFPFRYLTDDYGLRHFAAFPGCSSETEASFETVAFLAQKVDELKLKNVLVIENSDQRIAQTVVQATKDKNQAVLAMDSLQSVRDQDVASGKTYLSAMEGNLSVLEKALA